MSPIVEGSSSGSRSKHGGPYHVYTAEKEAKIGKRTSEIRITNTVKIFNINSTKVPGTLAHTYKKKCFQKCLILQDPEGISTVQ